MRINGEVDEFEERRRNKSKLRQQRWQERQERSKATREEIELLTLKRSDLRRRLDDRASQGDANTIEAEEDTYAYFSDLPISQRTLLGLERGNYKKMTPIQSDALHLALAGYDVLGAAKTGSGKTLCFVIPVLEKLLLEHWGADMGLGALILSPTRELALQIFKVLQVIGFKHVFSAALLTGGRDVGEERKRLHQMSIIVGTPGRVLHHLQDNANFVLDNLQLLCLDEADRLLDLGFREALTGIIRYLPPQRQTLLFSATQTNDVQMLAQMSLHNPRYVSAQTATSSPTPSTLCQNFIVVELHRKLDVLLMFLKRHPNDKIVVFVSTCNQVRYMYLAFSKILKKMRIPSMCLTSKMRQFRRDEVFKTFCRCKSAVLFCTDVASRGLDFPLVHWVVQYDCPDSAQTYIHRAGRTARAGARGVSLLFLTPREVPMLSYLAHKNVPMREIAVKPGAMHVSHEIFVALVVQGLKYEAQKAFIAYLRSVYFASNKHVFDVKSIDVEAFSKSLGLLVVPDMTDLLKLQRNAKNLPWDIVNYIALKEAKNTPGKGASHLAQRTRKEKHLEASDMFRVLEQRQRYAARRSPFGGDANCDSDDDDEFLVRKSEGAGDEGHGGAEMLLTAEERLAGLSKHKRRKFIDNPDIRVRDLGLSTHIVFHSSEDEVEEDGQRSTSSARQGENAVAPSWDLGVREAEDGTLALHHRHPPDSEGKEEGGEESFTKIMRQRVEVQKESDRERTKRLRRLRRLQKIGKISKKSSLEESGVRSELDGTRHTNLRTHSSSSSDNDDVSSNGSLSRLIRAARGELYPTPASSSSVNSIEDADETTEPQTSRKRRRAATVAARSREKSRNAYHNIDSESDNDSDETEAAKKTTLKTPRATKRKR